MKKTLRAAILSILSWTLAGCASTGNGAIKTLTQEGAAHAIVIGKSTRADINESFGSASVTKFSNGYELWLYQLGYSKMVDSLPYVNLVLSSAENKRELSILFDQAGVVKKYQLVDQQP
ncbi:hypothetical protein [Massilia sp. erpn]|uniref:hypothetical protein n=1 Tax=Massilia sp. erpn TaxID=2738142 RepID=UPI00210577B5|nr:hypothetical protein [Massilia sp. erpn]UTY59720.1 hypothetical protein HPQ68_22605 [Massilia sp. erpn]